MFTANRYAYANCNPTNYTDPTGLTPSPGCVYSVGSFALAGAALASSVTGGNAVRLFGNLSAVYDVAATVVNGLYEYYNTADGLTGEEALGFAEEILATIIGVVADTVLGPYVDAINATFGVVENCFGIEVIDPILPIGPGGS